MSNKSKYFIILTNKSLSALDKVKKRRSMPITSAEVQEINEAVAVKSRVELPKQVCEQIRPPQGHIKSGKSSLELVRTLVKSSGIYALSSMTSPLVSLLLLPYLTHALSHADYGALAVLDTLIYLLSSITIFGVDAVFSAIYAQDCRTRREKRYALSTLALLLFFMIMPIALVGMMVAPRLSLLLLNSTSYSTAIDLTVFLVVLQNLTTPGLMWMRVEGRAVSYSIVSIANCLLMAGATVLLVGVFHRGILGALVAMGIGNAAIVVGTLPLIFLHTGFRLRFTMVVNMLMLGVPYAMNAMTMWLLQLSDRYLLAHFVSLSAAANYTIAYSLGGGVGFLITRPFSMAWWVLIYPIARRDDAAHLFKLIFRWYSFFLLFATLSVSLLGVSVLDFLFPASYRGQSLIISAIALATVFNSFFIVFNLGMTLRRKTWLAFIALLFSALLNFGINLFLIPLDGAMGAAIATLVAYIVLALVSYVFNQIMYPVPFEVGLVMLALGIGIVLYVGDTRFVQGQSPIAIWSIHCGLLLLYGSILAGLGILPRDRKKAVKGIVEEVSRMKTSPAVKSPVTGDSFSARTPIKVCMLLMERVRVDPRVLRDATALIEEGFAVTIVDVERDRVQSPEEIIHGVHVKHLFIPGLFVSPRFKPWFFVKLSFMTIYSVIQLVKMRADIYHAHVEHTLPACYLATRLLRRPLIFDAPDLTLSDPKILRWRRLRALSIRFLAYMVSRCSAVITASPHYVAELRTLYHASKVTVVRNVPLYKTVSHSDRLRQHLELGPEVRIALYQGYIQANRELERLVLAAKYLEPNIVIVIMGGAVEPVYSQLVALIARERVADRVKLLPAVPYTELLDWTASADIGLTIFPPDYSLSIRFTLPNKLFEYLMAGRPVLSTQLDAIAEVIKAYDVGCIVPSVAPSAIGTAINGMLADTTALARMHRNALDVARQEFSWEKERHALLDVYYRCLGSTREETMS